MLALTAALGSLSCSVGQGSGQVSGQVTFLDCRTTANQSLSDSNFSLRPNFFGADFIEDTSPCAIFPCSDDDGAVSDAGSGRVSTPHLRRRVLIRLQRGSYRESDSDGLLISVNDVNRIKREQLGQPLTIGNVQLRDGTEPQVRMTLYLNETCVAGFPRQFWSLPAIMEAVSGTIIFDQVYAPDVTGSSNEFVAHFDNVRFQRSEFPEARNATLNGNFRFTYQRGRPAQRF